MNLKEIKELIALMNENELMELEIERDGMKIRLRKLSSGGKIETITEEHAAPSVRQIVKPEDKVVEPADKERNLTAIKAPMVGTFYRSASPDTKPYVEMGQA